MERDRSLRDRAVSGSTRDDAARIAEARAVDAAMGVARIVGAHDHIGIALIRM